MMRNYLKLTLTFVLLSGFLGSCSFLKEISTLAKCEFRMTTLENPRLAGVDVSRIRSYSDLGLADMAVLTASIVKGELPLSFTLNVEAKNPNPAMAALNRLEYMAYIDEVQVATGSMDRRIEIPANGGTAIIPLQLSTDLIEILNKDSRQALVNFGLNLADAGKRPTRVSLKIKPTILIGAVEINYPGYFTIKQDFTSGGQE